MAPNDKADIIRECKQVGRAGLYVLVWVILIQSCDVAKKHDIRRLEEKIDAIQRAHK